MSRSRGLRAGSVPSRWAILAASLGLLLAACGGGAGAPGPAKTPAATSGKASAPAASALTHVDLLLDWVPSGEHAPFYVALAKGFYKAAGLDVKIIPGKGSVSTMQQVGQGNYPIGLASGSIVATGITKGIPIKAVAEYFQKDPDGVIVLDKSGIQKPQDLIGKKVAYAAGGVSAIAFKAFEVANHIQTGQITVVTTGPETLAADLAEGKVAGVGDFATDIVPPLAVKGVKARPLYYADWGVPGLSTGMIANTAYVRAHPDIVKAVVQATNQGWAFALANPDQTIALTKSMLPAADVSAPEELRLSLTLLHSPNTEGKPIGWMSDKDWQNTLTVLEKYQGLKDPKPLSDYFTNEFIAQS